MKFILSQSRYSKFGKSSQIGPQPYRGYPSVLLEYIEDKCTGIPKKESGYDSVGSACVKSFAHYKVH